MRALPFVFLAVLALGTAACGTAGDGGEAPASAPAEITPLPPTGPAGSTAIPSTDPDAVPGAQ